ncbi:HTTM domain-containing protein [Curtobacterium flaccumfaciens]|uniref:HTTM domain-containing protein n=1 Tax=Curtobacterium flaccumfaciens TaxID=2035 RepID=UPI001BDE5D0D|nr:HTTM domain-containing protein [Curtobacterium flaccumfaciens]MBT1632739.1 HTTM domain-containing protein [Curtobacterium flaccumfaciens pv. oortii]MCX2846081.1 HTTM domain-containing protein [Curtobacterium flaccumfaciens pv. oortii]
MDPVVIRTLRSRVGVIVDWMVDAPRATTALSLLRAVVGVVSTAFYIRQYAGRSTFFGPDGVYGLEGIRDYTAGIGTWSLYAATDSAVYFEVVFHIGLVVAVLVTLGVGGRLVLAAHYVLLWSLYMANPAFMDGGDALSATAVLFLLLTRCYSAFTIVKGRRKREAGPGASVLNNTGLLLLVTQVTVVYLMAGLYKVQGELWQDGTALYYILNVPEFFLPGITPLLVQSDWLMVIGAYATVLTSVFFPVLVFFRAGRPVAVTAMLTFHLAIALLMGLTLFALVMAAYDLLFVNAHVVTLHRRARSLWEGAVARLSARFQGGTRGSESA